jgi:hypothetical protein
MNRMHWQHSESGDVVRAVATFCWLLRAVGWLKVQWSVGQDSAFVTANSHSGLWASVRELAVL